jgi:transcriptional regulator with XRE-family HTH domain
MAVDDVQIGRNLARFRGQWSQKDLADAMRERGHKWSQATVWAVEKGDRPLRLSEAQDVTKILKMHTWDLTHTDARAVLTLALRDMNAASWKLRDAAQEYLRAQLLVASLADVYESSGHGDREFDSAEEDVTSWLAMSPEEEVSSARKELKAENEAQKLINNFDLPDDVRARVESNQPRTGRFEAMLRRTEEKSLG